MNRSHLSNHPTRALRTAAALLVTIGVTVGAAGCHAPQASEAPGLLPHTTPDDPGTAGGELPPRATAFDVELPGVAKLDPDLLTAVQRATTDAGADDVEIHINSGWRSPQLQNRFLDEAVEQYGSREEASRWVATPETSAHVSGDAVDIGGIDARQWLGERGGARYGLCQIYSNEPWHFEYVPAAVGGDCPRPYRDPTQDPRMQ